MKHLDRHLQRDLLNQLAEAYPENRKDVLPEGDPHSSVSVNLHYLQEHGLVQIGKPAARPFIKRGAEDREARTVYRGVAITAAGIDFLEEDGGLSAILGVVTVRLHSETIREIEAKILASNQPETEKTRLLDRLRSMPEEGLKTLTQELVRTGLNHSPGMWETVLRHLSG
ncbi:hypothetical protein B4O83_12380 [Chromohalobacter israelensis]|nr:hypothetical protein B4O83_12380 [Chromohalobacter salexigens]